MTKIKKNSAQYQENIRKQQFLNRHGVKVKIDGSWGSWQQKQYERIKSTNKNNVQSYIQDIFNNIMIGAAVADNPSVMTASGWKQDKEGNYIQKRTKGSDQLADNLETIGTAAITAPTLARDITSIYNIVRHPIQTGKTIYTIGKDIYTSGKDLIWLAKTYNKVGTGLTNPYVRNKFLDLAKSPSTSRSFIEKYTPNKKEAGLNLSQIKEALPQLENLQEEFGIVPQADFKNYYTVSNQIEKIKNGLQYAKDLSIRYNQELEFLKNNNEILYNIAKESPQYQQQIVNDLKNGNIGNIEDYVKNLIKQSNTFLRRMNLKSNQNFTEAFSTIRGRSSGRNGFAMDVGNAEVVFDPIWSRGYGNTTATYTPKEIKLEGPVETWWSQRKPNFKDTSIQIESNGMHTDRAPSTIDESITATQNANRYLQTMNIPNAYNRKASHMIFLSPNKGASISDQFTIIPGYQKELKYTLGYKKGGKFTK